MCANWKTRGNRDTRISSDYGDQRFCNLFTRLLTTCCSSIFISSVVVSFLHKNSENILYTYAKYLKKRPQISSVCVNYH